MTISRGALAFVAPRREAAQAEGHWCPYPGVCFVCGLVRAYRTGRPLPFSLRPHGDLVVAYAQGER